MKSKLFSADGIRGIIGKPPLKRENVEYLGRALASWLRQTAFAPIFLLGTDTRESSQCLKAALTDGLTRGGIQVVDAGILPTAAISYLIVNKGIFAGGAMVSASHNPIVENGIKVFDERGAKIADDTEQFIESLYFGNTTLPFEIRPAVMIPQPDFVQQYAKALARELSTYPMSTPNTRIVIDCAQGAVSTVAPLVLDSLHIPYTAINISPDGTNINHHAGSEYVRLNPYLLAQDVRRYRANIGVAFDGDADRGVFVDSLGQLYDGDLLLAILALAYQRERRLQQNTVITTAMSNSGLAHYLRQHKITTRVVENGDKYITRTLIADDLTLGGEEIGHIIAHTDNLHVTGDGLRTALLVLSALAALPGARLSDLVPGMRKWPQIKASVWIGRGPRLLHQDEIPGLSTVLQKTREAIADLTKLECRPASTEPVYRIMLEARITDSKTLAQHTHRIATHIQQHLGRVGSPISILDCANGGCID